MISWLTLILLVPLVSTIPLARRASNDPICGQYMTVESHPYSLLTNHWGESDATSGSQCSTLNSIHDNTVAWTTSYVWTGGSSIKSYSNIQLNAGINQPLSAITSMESTWHWSQTNDGPIVADVAYDLFTSYTAGGSKVNEVMIWLANFNSKPISFEYNYDGTAFPIATNLDVAGHKWNLYYGSNGYNNVYSFLSAEGSITHFSADIYGFFTYLSNSGYVDPSEYLIVTQGGTEVTAGTGTLKTTAYSLTIA